ncbi:MAG TPA: formimidoylglutamate deiminase [Jatrophihabitantaceae bacterium]|nr:formimidoylglutamate deiminase [Jatrophihabitantaceae bacterium]
MTTYFADYALLPGGLARDVSFDVRDGVFASVTANAGPDGARRLPGIVLPGFANAHSHAFHRALRGRTHDQGGTFWTWRECMYAVAERLDPDSYLALARATYAEMALAGVTTVAEFHYLHHAPDGSRYADPNAMAEALRVAASDAGVRLTLLDACYLAGGLDADGHRPPDATQRRFCDADVEAWAERVAALRESDGMRVGAAIHSVRAVPRESLAAVRAAAGERPLHVHLSEQPAENEACAQYYGCTPTELLGDTGVLGRTLTAVHATHLLDGDIELLGAAHATACFCPTTERDLADGIGPARALHDAGVALSLGSDQHAVIDLLEEARALEMHERLSSLRRGRLRLSDLLGALTAHASIGWPDAGRLAAGARADLVAIGLDTPRTAGIDPAQVVLAATAADIDTVLVDGEVVVDGGQHRLGDVGGLLTAAIEPLWRES